MRRSAWALGLLLAMTPAAAVAEVTPNAKPETRAVEVAAPEIRKEISVAPARAEANGAGRVRSAQPLQRRTYIILLFALAIAVAVAFMV